MKASLSGVVLSLAVASSSDSVGAAPVVGPPFFLSNPKADAPEYSVASSSSGILLGWSALGRTYAQRYTPSASLDGRPFLLASETTTQMLGSHGGTSTSGVVVVSNGVDFAARWTRTTTLLMCCVATYTWNDFEGAVVRASGPPQTSTVLGTTGMPTTIPFGAIASAAPGWALLSSIASITPTTGTQSTSLEWVSADGTSAKSVSLLSAAVSVSTGGYTGFEVASDGVTALASWVSPAPAARSFVVVPRSGAPSPLVGPKLPTAADSVFLASNGAGYFVLWQSAGGALQGLRLTSTGAVSGTPIMISKSSDAGAAPSVVAVQAASGTYLILLRQMSGDGGSRLVGIRIAADGSVLDTAPFDVPAGDGGSLTSAGDGVWLLATLDSVNGAPIIRGRFIGDSTVPSPPDNVEPPPLPDAGATDAAAKSDAGPTPPPGNDGSVAQRDGAAMPPRGNGGSGSIVSPAGSGGISGRIDAATGAPGAQSAGGATVRGGCACTLDARSASPTGLGAYSFVAGVVALLRWRRQAVRRGRC